MQNVHSVIAWRQNTGSEFSGCHDKRRLSSQIARLSKFQTAIRGFYVNSQNRFQVMRELKRLLFI